jgi:hypothetical protein
MYIAAGRIAAWLKHAPFGIRKLVIQTASLIGASLDG